MPRLPASICLRRVFGEARHCGRPFRRGSGCFGPAFAMERNGPKLQAADRPKCYGGVASMVGRSCVHMPMHLLSARELREAPEADPAPHVVVLGAGASRAAFPAGDGSGKPVPLMGDLGGIAGHGWRTLIRDTEPPAGSFEAQFAWVKESGRFADRLLSIEANIVGYFRRLELPEGPTLYDHLVLGMRGQDTIATFNWDPFLLRTYQRHVRRFGRSRLPDLRFLHGSVAYATCEDHDILGCIGECCGICGKGLKAVEPVFPAEKKDYVSDPLLRREWEVVLSRLRSAFQLTMFGYSGPTTDVEARRLLRLAWAPEDRQRDHLEVVDLLDQAALERRWREFIPFSHLLVHAGWERCSVARWPRRTFEWKRAASIYGRPTERVGPCGDSSLEGVEDWYSEISEFEQSPTERARDGIALDVAADAHLDEGGQRLGECSRGAG